MEMERQGDEIIDISLGIFRQLDILKCFLLDKLEDILFGLWVIFDYLKDIKVNEFNRNDWYFVV